MNHHPLMIMMMTEMNGIQQANEKNKISDNQFLQQPKHMTLS